MAINLGVNNYTPTEIFKITRYVAIEIQYINLNFCLSHTNTKYNACTNAGLPLGKDKITETLQTEISQKYSNTILQLDI